MLAKLSSFESDDWDPTNVRSVVDLSLILDGIIGRFEEMEAMLKQKGDARHDTGVFMRVIPRFRQYKESFERKSVALMDGHPQAAGQTAEQASQFNAGDVPEAMFYQLDEAFWEEIIGDWNAVPSG